MIEVLLKSPVNECRRQKKVLHQGHLDDEGEDVVDEGVEELVGEHPPGQMRHALQLVVDEQLRRHHDEPERQQEPVQHRQHERVPTLGLFL